MSNWSPSQFIIIYFGSASVISYIEHDLMIGSAFFYHSRKSFGTVTCNYKHLCNFLPFSVASFRPLCTCYERWLLILNYNRGKWEMVKKLKRFLVNIKSIQVFFLSLKRMSPIYSSWGLQIFCEINLLLSVVHSKYKCTLRHRWLVSMFLSVKTHDAWSH